MKRLLASVSCCYRQGVSFTTRRKCRGNRQGAAAAAACLVRFTSILTGHVQRDCWVCDVGVWPPSTAVTDTKTMTAVHASRVSHPRDDQLLWYQLRRHVDE